MSQKLKKVSLIRRFLAGDQFYKESEIVLLGCNAYKDFFVSRLRWLSNFRYLPRMDHLQIVFSYSELQRPKVEI